MLYLPPNWGHDGVAVGGNCMTCSVGFQVPQAEALARELLLRVGDEEPMPSPFYRDPDQAATENPAAVPQSLLAFAQAAIERRLSEPQWLARTLGEVLTEPKPQVWFEGPGEPCAAGGVRLSHRTKMLYDPHHVFINGEAFEARGRDARLMRQLADGRALSASAVSGLSPGARQLLDQWVQAGWAIREAA